MSEPIPAEVVVEPPPMRTVTVPQVRLNLGTTLQNPWFWMLLGAAGTFAAMCFFHSKVRRE